MGAAEPSPPGGSGSVARAYHEATKHSFESVRRRSHFLDWDNKPNPFKTYRMVDRTPLPEGSLLQSLLRFGAGLNVTVRSPGGEEIRFRTYASAGALYPVEVYVACADLPGLDAGVYHFDPGGAALDRLRAGDHRGFVTRATASDPAVAEAPIVLMLTGIPWRTAWKYTERGYRHLFWDAGMILANLEALCAADEVPLRTVTGFADDEVEALLGVDGKGEFPICLVAVGRGAPAPAAPGRPEAAVFDAAALSPRELRFQAIREANDAGRLADPPEVEAWRRRAAASAGSGPDGPAGPRGAVSSDAESSETIQEVILRRGSARFFGPGPIPVATLERILLAAVRPASTEVALKGEQPVEPYLIAGAVEGLPPGSFVYRDGGLARLRDGAFRAEAGYLCLEQRVAAEAAATIFLMAELDVILDGLGDRGYRTVQLLGGLVAGRVYLGAYARGFGATGLTFYDDDVTEFFSPDAAERGCLLVVAVGESPRLAKAAQSRYKHV